MGARSTATNNWRWVDGRSVHCHYIAGNVKNNCGLYVHKDGWYDGKKKHTIVGTDCSRRLGFICQMHKYQN